MTDRTDPVAAKDRLAYIEVMPCGCVTGAITDEPYLLTEIGKFFRAAAKVGATVEHVPSEQVRERFAREWPCEHVKQAKAGVAEGQEALNV